MIKKLHGCMRVENARQKVHIQLLKTWRKIDFLAVKVAGRDL